MEGERNLVTILELMFYSVLAGCAFHGIAAGIRIYLAETYLSREQALVPVLERRCSFFVRVYWVLGLLGIVSLLTKEVVR